MMHFKSSVLSSTPPRCCWRTPLFAQEAASNSAADEENADSETILVTAQFREQNLQDTPLAITAINSAIA